MNMSKKARMYEKIERHGRRLQAIFPNYNKKYVDPVKLCKRLFTLENQGNMAATIYCNGNMSSAAFDAAKDKIMAAVFRVLGEDERIFFNSDPRGYTLKIRDEIVRRDNLEIEKDWGGYGIIAPDFSEGE